MRLSRAFGFSVIVSCVTSLFAGGARALVPVSSISGPYSVTVASTPETYYVITGSSGAKYDLLQQASWTSSEAEAQALGTNLLTITSATQNSSVLSDVAFDFSNSVAGLNLTAVPLWIGLNDKSHDPLFGGTDDGGTPHAGDFAWVDGSTSSYRNWNPGEPNDNDGPGIGEYYTALNWQYAATTSNPYGTWNDTPDAGTNGNGGNTGTATGYYGIAPVVPEPTSMALLAAGTGLLRRRNRSADSR